jgi:hypothetical protein
LSFGIIAVFGTFFFLGNCRVKVLLKPRPFCGDVSAAFGNDSDVASTTIAEVPVEVREVAVLNENGWNITQNVIPISGVRTQPPVTESVSLTLESRVMRKPAHD